MGKLGEPFAGLGEEKSGWVWVKEKEGKFEKIFVGV